MSQRLYLRKTDKDKLEKNPKLPYFKLVLPPEGDGEGDWEEVGAFWKAKTGNGYSGKTQEGVVITITKSKNDNAKEADVELEAAYPSDDKAD